MAKSFGEGNGTPLQYSCLENPMDGGAWWAAVHGVATSWTRLSKFTFTFHLHALEKETATHSSVLAWRIPGMGEPGGLPSIGSRRVGHDWSYLAAVAAAKSLKSIIPSLVTIQSQKYQLQCAKKMAGWFQRKSIEKSLECQRENFKSQSMMNVLTSETDWYCQIEGG